MELYVIIVIIQDMYVGIVGSCRIKIESFNLFLIINHLSLLLLLSLHSLSKKTNTCFLSSSSTWVIDSRATDHMTGNSNLFTMFQSHRATSTVTLADGSISCVLGSRTIHQMQSFLL